jgi:uroporphyrinogen-III synthase
VKVWVTREESHDGPLCQALRAVNLTPILEPVIERRVVDDCAAVIQSLGPDDWLVLTSPYAIESVAAEPARVPKVAVVGRPSREHAEKRGLRVELVSPKGGGASLFNELRRRASSGRVCYPRSSLAKAPQAWGDVDLLAPVLYETAARKFDRTVLNRVDVVAVASPSAVNAVGPVDLPFASIGPTTSDALRALGMEPWVEAPEPRYQSLAETIAAHDSESRHHRA